MNEINEHVECNVNSYAGDIVKRADKDYITARMCYFHTLTENFLWNGQQCVEKYLKSMALYHDVDVKHIGHNLKELFKKINKRYELKSINLFPKKIDGLSLIEEEFTDFLERLTYLGMNRYSTYPTSTYGDELIKLDATVFIIRRYCCPIGAALGEKGRPYEKQVKNKIDNGGGRPMRGYLTEIMKNNSVQKEWFLKENYYFPEKKDITPQHFSCMAYYPKYVLRYQEALHGSKEHKLIFIEMAEYLLDHLFFENSIRREIEEAIRKLYKEIINGQGEEQSPQPSPPTS